MKIVTPIKHKLFINLTFTPLKIHFLWQRKVPHRSKPVTVWLKRYDKIEKLLNTNTHIYLCLKHFNLKCTKVYAEISKLSLNKSCNQIPTLCFLNMRMSNFSPSNFIKMEYEQANSPRFLQFPLQSFKLLTPNSNQYLAICLCQVFPKHFIQFAKERILLVFAPFYCFAHIIKSTTGINRYN